MNWQLTLNDTDEDFKKNYQSILNKLLDRVPLDSVIQSSIAKTGSFYSGHLNILSSGQKFLAKTLSKTPQHAVAELIEQIQTQISHWHKTRFN